MALYKCALTDGEMSPKLRVKKNKMTFCFKLFVTQFIRVIISYVLNN